MKRMYIRALWGYADKAETDSYSGRRSKMDNDIDIVMYNDNDEPFMTYVCGQKNFDYLKSKNINCKLLSKDPFIYEPIKGVQHMYGHKLYVMQAAMEDYDEIVFLDWDCMAATKIPNNFWSTLGEKEAFQASMRGYKKRKCHWRRRDKRQRPCASFVYFRDKKIIDEMVEMWEKDKRRSEEDVFAKYTDEMIGGWQGADKYWELFEPHFFNLDIHEIPFRCFPTEKVETKNLVFVHMNRSFTNPIVRHLRTMKNEENKRKFVTDSINENLKNIVI